MLFRNDVKERVESDQMFREAIENARIYKPNVENDYSWVASHASEEYKRLESILDALDDKADGLIKYLGAGSGLLSLAFPALTSGNWVSALQACPTLMLLIAAIFFAARARTPGKIPLVPLTKDALAYADAYGRNVAIANFAAMTGVSSVALTLVIKEKAELIRSAFRMFVFAVSWLGLSVVISALGWFR